tara:strand:- start:1269 stop:3200 length:1932 start_codon:yes stop_codon:yes gene_type:complete
MANKVVDDNEIYLGGTYYPLNRPVQSVLASIYPSKVTIGDTTRDSNLRSSIIAWSDWRGGIGVERMQGPADADRAWHSTCNLRHRHHLVLPALSAATTAELSDGTAITGAITFIQDLGTELYAGYGNTPYYYSEGGDHWTQVTNGGSAYSFPATPTDSITVSMSGTDYIVVAHEGGYSYFSSATTVVDKTTDARFLSFWDDRLWGIDKSGQLWYTLTINGTPVNDALLPVQEEYVTDLFVARDAAGEQILYAATKVGLFAHDISNTRWVETQFQLPFHQFNGTGSVRWRDSIYNPSGLGIYKYINGTNNAVVTVMGPDRDDGLPATYRGTIKKLVGTHTELIAAVDATTAPGAQAATDIPFQYGASAGLSGHSAQVIADSSGQSSIVAWNDTGWETKWIAPSSKAGKPVDKMLVSNAGKGDYRLWWGLDGQVYHQLIPFDVTNPSQLVSVDGTDYAYESTGFHETPWFDAQQVEVDKLALKLKVEVEDASSDETVAVEYAIDYSTSYTSLGTISSSGTTTYTFGSGVGVSFRSIKFKLTLSRGSDTSKSPDVVSTTLEFRKKLEAKYGHTVEVDLNNTYKGKNPKQLRSALISSIESNLLQEFTFRDDGGGTRNYYVDVTSATGIEYTGYDERGSSRITLVEP